MSYKNTPTRPGINCLLTVILVIFSVSLCVADTGFDRGKDKKHGHRHPRLISGDTLQDPATGTTFVYVSAGCFMMGCDDDTQKCRNDETPKHKVCLDEFWIGRYEVTQALWQKVMGNNPSRQTGDENLPVENVSFEDVRKFIRKLNSSPGQFYSLPTEAQWEYACGLRPEGMQAAAPLTGSDHAPDANCATCGTYGQPGMGPGKTTPVGSYPPNFLGLYDMLGNVKEWCADFYEKDAYEIHSRKNPLIREKSVSRVIRGGSFRDNASHLTCYSRDKSIPALKSSYTGFRLIMVVSGLHR